MHKSSCHCVQLCSGDAGSAAGDSAHTGARQERNAAGRPRTAAPQLWTEQHAERHEQWRDHRDFRRGVTPFGFCAPNVLDTVTRCLCGAQKSLPACSRPGLGGITQADNASTL